MKFDESENWLTPPLPWRWFAVDIRSLTLFRICLGLLLICDLLSRIPDVEAFFSDFGVCPRYAATGTLARSSWDVSVHLLSGKTILIQLLLAVQIAFAIGIVIGWKTRWCVFLSWVLLISIQNRNILVLDSGDVLLRSLMFWSLFIPLGNKWSVDHWQGKRPSSWANFKYRNQLISAGAIAVMAQLIMMYVFAGRLKTGAAWLETHTAIEQAMRCDQFTREAGYWLLNYPDLMKKLTWATILLEKWGWLILFTPVFIGPARVLAALMFIGFHAGIESTMALGSFQWVCMAAWMLLLPSWFWDTLLPWCSRPLRFARKWKTKILAWIKTLATHLWGAKKKQRVSSKPTRSWRSTVMGAFICFFLLHLVLLWNLREDPGYAKMYENPALKKAKHWPLYLNHESDGLVRALSIEQKWSMFAPHPRIEDGWYVIVGETAAGETVDVLRHPLKVDWSKPERVAKSFPNVRWRKYLGNLWLKKHHKHRLYYARYLTRKWKREHPEKDWLKKFTIYFMKEETLPNGQEATPKPFPIWNHDCLK